MKIHIGETPINKRGPALIYKNESDIIIRDVYSWRVL